VLAGIKEGGEERKKEVRRSIRENFIGSEGTEGRSSAWCAMTVPPENWEAHLSKRRKSSFGLTKGLTAEEKQSELQKAEIKGVVRRKGVEGFGRWPDLLKGGKKKKEGVLSMRGLLRPCVVKIREVPNNFEV